MTAQAKRLKARIVELEAEIEYEHNELVKVMKAARVRIAELEDELTNQNIDLNLETDAAIKGVLILREALMASYDVESQCDYDVRSGHQDDVHSEDCGKCAFAKLRVAALAATIPPETT